MNWEMVLGLWAAVALGFFFFGFGLRSMRFARLWFSPRRYGTAAEREANLDASSALKLVLAPLYSGKQGSDRMWRAGCVLYHIAILGLLCGYGLTAGILTVKAIFGATPPDLFVGAPSANSYSLANVVALVFGNAEPVAARYLFGDAAPLFVGLTWFEVGCAIVGNMMLITTVLRARVGVTCHGPGGGEGRTIGGCFCSKRLAVRLMIFSIIGTEVAGRLALVDHAAHLHAVFGLGLLAVLPYSYLAHVLYALPALVYATRRRQRRFVA